MKLNWLRGFRKNIYHEKTRRPRAMMTSTSAEEPSCHQLMRETSRRLFILKIGTPVRFWRLRHLNISNRCCLRSIGLNWGDLMGKVQFYHPPLPVKNDRRMTHPQMAESSKTMADPLSRTKGIKAPNSGAKALSLMDWTRAEIGGASGGLTPQI